MTLLRLFFVSASLLVFGAAPSVASAASAPAATQSNASRAASPAASPAPKSSEPAPPSVPESHGLVDSNKEATAPDDPSSARNAARTRMRECGHQWSSMKKSGQADGTTWKEFSQGCLARK